MLFFALKILIVVISFVLVAFVTFYIYCRHLYGYWKKRGVYTPKPIFPYGNVYGIFTQKTFGETFLSLYEELKASGHKYVGFYFGWRPTFLPLQPELFKAIMTKDFHHFVDRGNYSDEEFDPLSANLFNLEGLKWKLLRQKMTPTFTSGKMKMMFNTLLACGDELIKAMDKNVAKAEPVDIKDMMARFTTDVIGSCAFGIECNSLQNPDIEFRVYGKKIFEPEPIDIVKGFLSTAAPSFYKKLRAPVINPKITAFFTKVVTETVSYREKNNVIRKDFMQLLIELKNHGSLTEDDQDNSKIDDIKPEEELGRLTLNEIVAQAFLFFVAGFETSSTTLQFVMYELAVNTDVQERLRRDVYASLQKYGGNFTYEGIRELKYLDMVITETLRIYPPVGALNRQCTEDYQIPDSDIVIEKGTSIFIPIWGVQMDPEYYPDPEKFDPERFSDEEKSKRHPYAWLPFGEGPRNCIGDRFAQMQMKLAVALLISKYKLSLNPKTKTPFKMDPKVFMITPIDGIWIDFEKL